MKPTANESRWRELAPYIDAIKSSIENPSEVFFGATWSELPESFVLVITKLRALTAPEEIEFLTCAADEEGSPTALLLAITPTLVIRSGDDQPVVEAWSRRDLNQLSVQRMAPHALPTEPVRGFEDRPSELIVELRYHGREPITVPFSRGSLTCVRQLEAAIPTLKEDIAAVSSASR